MKSTLFEPLLRDATIKAIDGVARKVADAGSPAEKKVARLLTHWNEMERADKENAVGIAIAAITTTVTAIAAIRRKAKSPLKTAVRKVARRAAKKLS